MQSFWQNKKVLVTGHTGFKGAWLCQWLVQLQAEVAGFALEPDTSPALFELLSLQHRMTHTLGNINELAAIENAISSFEPEIVFHLAAQPLVIESYQQPIETLSTNVMGTAHLLDAVRRCPSVKSVVVITTDKVYQPSSIQNCHTESDPLGGHDPYSASKACTELVVSSYRQSFFDQPNSPLIASVRAGNVIGGGDFAANRLIPDICRAWARQEPVVIRNPDSIRPWQHVLDALNAYLLLAQGLYQGRQELAKAWNIGPKAEDMWPVAKIIKLMQTQWEGETAVQMEQPEYHENPCLMLDSSALQQALGWQPVWSLEHALQHTVSWYQAWAQDERKLVELTREQVEQFMSERRQPCEVD